MSVPLTRHSAAAHRLHTSTARLQIFRQTSSNPLTHPYPHLKSYIRGVCVGSAFWLACSGSSHQFQVQLKLSSQLLFGLFYPKTTNSNQSFRWFLSSKQELNFGQLIKICWRTPDTTSEACVDSVICFVQHNLLLNFVHIKHTLFLSPAKWPSEGC